MPACASLAPDHPQVARPCVCRSMRAAKPNPGSRLCSIAVGSSSVLEVSLFHELSVFLSLGVGLAPEVAALAAAARQPKALLQHLDSAASSFSAAVHNDTGQTLVYWLGTEHDDSRPEGAPCCLLGSACTSGPGLCGRPPQLHYPWRAGTAQRLVAGGCEVMHWTSAVQLSGPHASPMPEVGCKVSQGMARQGGTLGAESAPMQELTHSRQAGEALAAPGSAARRLWFRLEGQSSPALCVRLGAHAAWMAEVQAAPEQAAQQQRQDWHCTLAVRAEGGHNMASTIFISSGLEVPLVPGAAAGLPADAGRAGELVQVANWSHMPLRVGLKSPVAALSEWAFQAALPAGQRLQLPALRAESSMVLLRPAGGTQACVARLAAAEPRLSLA